MGMALLPINSQSNAERDLWRKWWARLEEVKLCIRGVNCVFWEPRGRGDCLSLRGTIGETPEGQDGIYDETWMSQISTSGVNVGRMGILSWGIAANTQGHVQKWQVVYLAWVSRSREIRLERNVETSSCRSLRVWIMSLNLILCMTIEELKAITA